MYTNFDKRRMQCGNKGERTQKDDKYPKELTGAEHVLVYDTNNNINPPFGRKVSKEIENLLRH